MKEAVLPEAGQKSGYAHCCVAFYQKVNRRGPAASK